MRVGYDFLIWKICIEEMIKVRIDFFYKLEWSGKGEFRFVVLEV